MDDVKNMVHTCFHCGNTGILNYIGQTRWNDEDIIFSSNGDVIHKAVMEHEDWYLFECPVCHRPVVIRQDTIDFAEYSYEPVSAFPSYLISTDGIPEEIHSAFEAAIRTKGIDSAICLLSLRRVLEMICKEKGAIGRDLEDKIENLISTGILSSSFSDACWVIRQLGNSAAHADKERIYTYQVEQTIEFVSTIINYLYSMPVRVAKMKSEIEKKKVEKERKKEATDEV